MLEMFKLLIGLVILILGIPIGNILARFTKEELADGEKYFKILIVVCLIGAIVSVIFRNDSLMFTFLFISIITSRSLKNK